MNKVLHVFAVALVQLFVNPVQANAEKLLNVVAMANAHPQLSGGSIDAGVNKAVIILYILFKRVRDGEGKALDAYLLAQGQLRRGLRGGFRRGLRREAGNALPDLRGIDLGAAHDLQQDIAYGLRGFGLPFNADDVCVVHRYANQRVGNPGFLVHGLQKQRRLAMNQVLHVFAVALFQLFVNPVQGQAEPLLLAVAMADTHRQPMKILVVVYPVVKGA